jgi:nitrogen-specific signal transduction histidine kinase
MQASMSIHSDQQEAWWHSIVALALRCHELAREIKQQQFELYQQHLDGGIEQETAEHINQLQDINECLQLLNYDLQQNHTLLQTILDSITDGLLLLDSSGTVLVANRPIALFLGKSPDDVTGQSWDTLCASMSSGHDTGLPLPNLQDLPFGVTNRPHPFHQRFQCTRVDGNRRVIDMYAFPVYHKSRTYPQPATTQVVLHIVDMTEQLVVDSLRREQERLAASRELIGKVAHAVNSPLQTILNSLILLEQASDDEQSELLALAQDEIERIGQLLHQLDHLYQGM